MDEHLDRQYLEVELYEKIVVRERRRKAVFITLTFTIFLFLCGIPVYNERFPKWESLKAARKIAVEIEKLKTESLQLKKPLLLSILETGQLRVEQVSHCSSASAEVPKSEGLLHEESWTDSNRNIALMSDVDAKKSI